MYSHFVMYYSFTITCVRRTSLYHYVMITYATWINAPSATLSDKAAIGNRNLGICPNIFRLMFCIVNFCILVSSRRGEVVRGGACRHGDGQGVTPMFLAQAVCITYTSYLCPTQGRSRGDALNLFLACRLLLDLAKGPRISLLQ